MSEAIFDEATKWRRVLALADEGPGGWLPGDLAHIWRHQLGAPLDIELADAYGEWARNNPQLVAPRTVGELLDHPAPPRELLKLVTGLAMDRRAQADFPTEIATALYYVVAAVALARPGERIAHLDDAALRRGFHWATRLPWLDQATLTVLEAALHELLTA